MNNKIVVLVEPITLKPTACLPPADMNLIFSGPYQNVAAVTEEWLQQERKRIWDDVIDNAIYCVVKCPVEVEVDDEGRTGIVMRFNREKFSQADPLPPLAED